MKKFYVFYRSFGQILKCNVFAGNETSALRAAQYSLTPSDKIQKIVQAD
jgi:hypothetical protein